MRSVRVDAPAKINLALRILGRRDDGYHELDTLFQAVSLSDEIVLTERPGPGIELSVDGADVGPVEENLALRAARAWEAESGIELSIDIHLVKRIPAGAGLGGGSSDAGAVLRALETMYGEPLGRQRLGEVGSGLGADVAFFCGRHGLARGRGIGDELAPVAELPPRPVLIVVPSTPIATPEAYRWVVDMRREGAPISEALGLPAAPSWEDLDRLAGNDFHPLAAEHVPEVRTVVEVMKEAGAEGVLLSGSGSALFGFAPTGDSDTVARRLETATPLSGCRVFRAETVSTLPTPIPIGVRG